MKRVHDACGFASSPRSAVCVLREKLHSKLRGPSWQEEANPQDHALIEQAPRTVSDADCRRVHRQIDRIVRDDAPRVFLDRPTNAWGVRPTLEAWRPRADSLLLLRQRPRPAPQSQETP